MSSCRWRKALPGEGSAIERQLQIGEAMSEGYWRLGVEMDVAATEEAVSPGAAALAFERAMCLIPAGTFNMGEDSAGIELVKPEHLVSIQAFYMDKYEVTRKDWATVAAWAAEHGYDLSPALRTIEHDPGPDHPAVPISWYDAVKWCNARSEMEGLMPAYYTDETATNVYRTGQIDLVAANVNWSGNGYRLPTEAEWEYAARGGLDGDEYPWGNESAIGRANTWQYLESLEIHNDPYPITMPVGYFDGTQAVPEGQSAQDMANGYGLYDMAANAYEWVWDYEGDYPGLEEYAPHGSDKTSGNRVLRGGSWWNNSVDARVFHRYPFPPAGDDPYGVNGFRRRPQCFAS